MKTGHTIEYRRTLRSRHWFFQRPHHPGEPRELKFAARCPTHRRVVIALLTVGLMSPVAVAELKPQQLLLVFNSNSKESRDLALYYAQARKIPQEQMVGLPLPLNDQIRREAYDTVAATVRNTLRNKPWGERITCLVVFYGVPIRIAPRHVTDAHRRQAQNIKTLRNKAVERLQGVVSEMEAKAVLKPPNRLDTGEDDLLAVLSDRYLAARDALSARVQAMADDEKPRAYEDLLKYVARVEGLVRVIPVMRENIHGSAERAAQVDRLSQAQAKARPVMAARRDAGPMSEDYTATLAIISKWHGLLGECRLMDEDAMRLSGKESRASFDSELSLILRDSYNLYQWQLNRLARSQSARDRPSPTWRTLMVSRIDAPTIKIARRMIDDAIAVEQEGLRGTFYVDARGLKKNDLYRTVDQDLIDLIYLLDKNANMRVVLDRKSSVFQPGTCPDAALYCGWYSVSKYVPAFTFVRGAVAVHIASFEAVSLRSEKPYWCAGLLRDGAAATLGPTSEPYLQAFPKPTAFFGRLLTGQLSLVECFYETKPFNSWQLTLLGDPLYRPFAKNPQLTPEQLERFITRTPKP